MTHATGWLSILRARFWSLCLSGCALTGLSSASAQTYEFASAPTMSYPETNRTDVYAPAVATDDVESAELEPSAATETWSEDDAPVCYDPNAWHWQLLPTGLAYRSYLAGRRESRLGNTWAHEQDQGWLWDIALGGRAAIFRYGTSSNRPEGWELQVEGAGLPRLGNDEALDVQAVDFRFGVPAVYAVGNYQTKLAYYHLSSHVGDEFLLHNPGFTRLNYVRDAIVWGNGLFVTPELRAYGEVAYAFHVDGGAEPWEFQFGLEQAPALPTGVRGAPFAAFNAHLREEFDYSGNLVVQVGWAWRGDQGGHLLRTGFEYFNGKDEQYSFLAEDQQKLGLGLWYDF